MNVLTENEYRIGLTLTNEELARYGITYDELDYSNIRTRRFLWSLTEDIRKSCGYNVSLSGKLLIEVMKKGEDKVKIYLTSLSEKNSDDYSLKQLIKVGKICITAEFSCFEEMLQASFLLKDDTGSCLFEKNGRYRLTVYCDGKNKEKIILSLCENADTVSENPIEEARSAEMWRLISSPFAVRQLTSAFSAD